MSAKRHISILTEGAEELGIGHITRCSGLYDAFKELNGEPRLVIAGDEFCEPHIRGKNGMLTNWEEIENNKDGVLDSDVLVIDSYQINAEFYETCLEKDAVTLILDDNIRCPYTSGTILNGAMNAQSLPYPDNPLTNYLLGSKFTPLRKEFWDVGERQTNEEISSVLIMMGGTDIRKITAPIVNMIRQVYPDIQVTIVSSLNGVNIGVDGDDDKIELIVNASAEELLSIFNQVDLAISAAGQSLYELARVGLPTIAVKVADNQQENVAGWMKAGFIEFAGNWNDADLLQNIEGAIGRLSTKNSRVLKMEIGQQCIDGQGARRVAKSCLQSLENK